MGRCWGRFALVIGAALLVSGCGGSQSQMAGVGAVPESPARQSQVVRHGKSWMLSKATSEDLLYVTKGCDGTCVISYPDGQLVGSLDTGHYYGAGACVDAQSNVFIANDTNVVEYTHGGTSPIQTLNLPGNEARGCAINPLTGDLAVAFVGSGENVAIFSQAKGTPTLYGADLQAWYCGYDTAGNLFVNGTNGTAQPALSELPNGGVGFIPLTITYKVGGPGQVQWDGTSMTWESLTKGDAKVSRLSISGSKASIVGTTSLNGIRNRAAVSWIYGNVIIVPYVTHGFKAKKVGVWRYPNGKKRPETYKKFAGGNAILQAVTVSSAPSH